MASESARQLEGFGLPARWLPHSMAEQTPVEALGSAEVSLLHLTNANLALSFDFKSKRYGQSAAPATKPKAVGEVEKFPGWLVVYRPDKTESAGRSSSPT